MFNKRLIDRFGVQNKMHIQTHHTAHNHYEAPHTNYVKYTDISHTPNDTCIYAIGDIHGKVGLLRQLHQIIEEDARKRMSSRKCLIYLGDYVDRGQNSREVLDLLINHSPEGFETVFLKGNHEDAMMQFLDSEDGCESWLSWGGDATLQSYGVFMRCERGKKLDYLALQDEFARKFPAQHRRFCEKLKLSHIEGDYMFVHAGLRPGVPIEQQTAKDMMSIRSGFVDSEHKFDKTIVFGHTIFNSPMAENGRIGVDTGAYATGRLTAVVLEGTEVGFLNT